MWKIELDINQVCLGRSLLRSSFYLLIFRLNFTIMLVSLMFPLSLGYQSFMAAIGTQIRILESIIKSRGETASNASSNNLQSCLSSGDNAAIGDEGRLSTIHHHDRSGVSNTCDTTADSAIGNGGDSSGADRRANATGGAKVEHHLSEGLQRAGSKASLHSSQGLVPSGSNASSSPADQSTCVIS